MKVFMIAGEESGDIHGSNLIRQLQKLADVSLYGTGGDNLKSLGQEQYFRTDQMTIIGLDDIVSNIPFIYRMFKTLEEKLDEVKPDLVILVDYPGFNLRFAKKAHAKNCKVVYYIAPQVWAWHYSRVHKIKKYIDKVLCILPFEEELFKREGIDATYVGNPVVDNMKYTFANRSEFCKYLSLDGNKEIIGLLPGSRKREISGLLPEMIKASEHFADNFEFVVAKAAGVNANVIAEYTDNTKVKMAENCTYDVMKYSKLAWVCSGTATLETSLNQTPMILLYKVGSLSWFIGKMLVKTKYAGLPNIIEGREIIPELLQSDMNAENIINKTEMILNNYDKFKKDIENISSKFDRIDPSKKAAEEILSII
ncbi:lipid-A-disaccharide synthase [Flexistipes sp.]|uniref:lipid-A-disaccharide synthase n=1 Tax=Flexistipes sp. TaxID=3088135 RepID=UPI002E240A43|nr:lipid-A-disaccharide synthase [Flexistipes sp.]